GVDLAVAVEIHAPLGPGGAEPAVFIRGLSRSLMVTIDLAVDLDTVAVIGPDIDLAVAVAVEEPADGLPLWVADQPAAAPAGALDQLALAGVGLLRGRNDVGDAFLPGAKTLEDGSRRGSVGLRQAARREQTARQHRCAPSIRCHPWTPFLTSHALCTVRGIF